MKLNLSHFKEKLKAKIEQQNIKTILRKVLFVILISIIFRFLSVIPVPGVPLDSLNQILSQYSFGEILDITSSGALSKTTLIAIGLGPYINASVILQLLATVIPRLKELQKQGIKGRVVINMYTRLLTVPLAILQSIVIYIFLQQSGLIEALDPLPLATLVSSFTGGSILLMWISELLTEDDFMNGSSYLIAAGILADIPGRITSGMTSATDQVMIITGIITLLWVGFIIFVTSAERKVTIKHSKIMSFGRKPVKDNHIPLKLNQSGVMPVIFALSFLSTPTLILDLLMKTDFISQLSWIDGVKNIVDKITNPDLIYYNLILTVLIILFSIFYTFVVFNPEDTASNLQKQGAYIPGVRPGEETSSFLTMIMLRLSFVGSLFLAFITLIPLVVPKILESTWTWELPQSFIESLSNFSFWILSIPPQVVSFLDNIVIDKDWSVTIPIFFSGTAILIVIRVALDVLDKVKSLRTDKYSLKGV